MAELVLSEAIPRFKQNEDRMDRFCNGDVNTTWVTSGGTPVPSIQKFLADRWAQINTPGLGWLAAAEAAADAANTNADRSETARDDAEAAADVLNTATLTGIGLAAVSTPLLKDSPTVDVPLASQAEAEAGTSPKAMNALRTAQAITKRAELADFTPSWTAGRTKPLRTLLRDWCRLDQDIQFDPTGTTLMNALIAAAWASYDTLILPKGVASASTIAPPRNNCRMVGEGPGSILRMPNGGNTNLVQATGRSGLRFENFTLEGNKANQIAGNGTDLQGCVDVRFDGVNVLNWHGNGIICQVNCGNVVIESCVIINVGSHGVSLSAVNVSRVHGNIITDARLAGVNYGACGNFNCSDNIITRNPALGATGGGAGGIRTTNYTSVGTISDNVVSCYDRGIMLITGATKTTVTGNAIEQPWYDGMLIGGTPAETFGQLDLTVSANTISNANQSNAGSYDGIRIADSSGAIIMTGNEIRDGRSASQMQYGIRDTSTGASGNLGRAANENWIGGAAIAATN